MQDEEAFDTLGIGAEKLNDTLEDTSLLVAGFDRELGRMRSALGATGKDINTLEKGLSRGLRKAFEGVAFDGRNLSDALASVAKSLANTTFNAAMKPVSDQFGGLVSQGVGALVQGILPFANGAPFSQGRVMPFAQGGIVSTATGFGMRGGMGLMPLARGPDGKLGVRGGGSGATTVIMNISTPDVQGFQRSQSQIAAQMSRALSNGNRNR